MSGCEKDVKVFKVVKDFKVVAPYPVCGLSLLRVLPDLIGCPYVGFSKKTPEKFGRKQKTYYFCTPIRETESRWWM